MLCMLGKISADDILKYFFLIYFSRKWAWTFHAKETVSMKCQSLFSGKNKKLFQNVVC